MGKPKRKKKPANPVDRFVRPTEAREAHNDFQSAGIAYRVVPVIATMLKSGQITQGQFDALNHYRDQASRAEDDCAQESTLAPARIMGGGGGSYGGKIPSILMATPAIIETARIERDLGSLQPLARAIAVDDWSLSRWCIEQHGGREKHDAKGVFVAMVPRGKDVVAVALLELKFAAGRIVR